ncbi:MAG: TetR/AcrR family transcriptional regulator [Desulfobacteraceae bacterium]|jgi:AcrR family transcriptional regulator
MGTKERKEREREIRRAEILEAAKAVFFSRGFQTATMDQVAKAAELSKGTLYLYFSCKEELYVSILLEGLDKLIRRFRNAAEGASGWEAKLRAVGKAYFEFYQEEKNYFQILFFLHHGELSTKIPENLFQKCTLKGIEALSYISKAVEKGIESGEAEPGDTMEAAVVAWGSMTGILLLYEEEEHRQFIPMPLKSVVKRTIDTLVEGFKKRAS